MDRFFFWMYFSSFSFLTLSISFCSLSGIKLFTKKSQVLSIITYIDNIVSVGKFVILHLWYVLIDFDMISCLRRYFRYPKSLDLRYISHCNIFELQHLCNIFKQHTFFLPTIISWTKSELVWDSGGG